MMPRRIIDADTLQAAREDSIRNPAVRIPTKNAVPEIAVQNLLNALNAVEHCQNAMDAKSLVQLVLDTGYASGLRLSDVIRAIEARLPAATPAQKEAYSIIVSKRTLDTEISRVLGAFGELVIVLRTTKEPGIPLRVIVLTARDTEIQTPIWDVPRPAERRVWHEPQTSTSAAGVA